MDHTCYKYLKEQPHLLRFIRYNPVWYRSITRNPDCLSEIEKEAKKFYGKTFPQKLEQMNEHMKMAHMVLSLTEAMKD
ncbi:YlbE-like family protein [Virgibacillus sp. W0430]|uniref:YlbE-like family protein n=1 Tax=Virgibacillus sp. W0430 TaxID=3391580 RepID=UPI003F4825D1